MLMGQLMSQIRASPRIKSFNFKCTVCKMSFARSSTLKVHQKTHEKLSVRKSPRNINDKITTPEFIDETDDDQNQNRDNDKIQKPRKRPLKLKPKPLKSSPRLKLKRVKIDAGDKESPVIESESTTIGNSNTEIEDINIKYEYDSSTNNQLNNHENVNVLDKINFDPLVIMDKLEPFKCQFCPKFYIEEEQLKVHILSDHNHKNKSGLRSPKKAIQKNQKNENNVQNQKSKRNICSYCPKSYDKPSELARHIRVHTKEKPFHCPNCSRSFSRKENLNVHMKIHQGVKPFKCQLCQKFYSRKADLYIHNEKYHSEIRPSKILPPNSKTEPVHKCPNCPKSYTTSQNLHRHERSQHAGVKYKCEFCEEFFTRTDNLDVHSRKFHKDQLEGSDGQKIGKVPKPQSSKTTNQNHITISAYDDSQDPDPNENQYKCPFCDESFRKRKRLKKHIDRTHEGEENPFECVEIPSADFTCSICSEKFLDETSIAEHSQEHYEVNYICEFCQESFTKRKRLQQHITNFHLDVKIPQSTLKVPTRPVPTKKAKSQLKPNENTSKSKNLFFCPMCPKKFSEHEALIKHSSNHRDFFLTL